MKNPINIKVNRIIKTDQCYYHDIIIIMHAKLI